jgi:hypothetical protein
MMREIVLVVQDGVEVVVIHRLVVEVVEVSHVITTGLSQEELALVIQDMEVVNVNIPLLLLVKELEQFNLMEVVNVIQDIMDIDVNILIVIHVIMEELFRIKVFVPVIQDIMERIVNILMILLVLEMEL